MEYFFCAIGCDLRSIVRNRTIHRVIPEGLIMGISRWGVLRKYPFSGKGIKLDTFWNYTITVRMMFYETG